MVTGDASGATIGIIIGVVVGLAIYLAVMIPFICSINKTTKHIPEDKRSFPNWFTWFFLIPFVELIFVWMMLPFGVPNALRKTLQDNAAAAKDAGTLKGLGLTLAILKTVVWLSHSVSVLALPLAIGALVIFIIYWVKIVGFRNKYFGKTV